MKDKNCLVCDSNAQSLPFEIGNGYIVNRCDVCHFTWVDRDSIAKVAKDPVYDDYQYNHGVEGQFKLMESIYRDGFLERLKRDEKTGVGKKGMEEKIFLDVGCANGEYLQIAKSVGIHKVYGVEIDKVAKEKASQYGTVVDDLDKLEGVLFDVIQIKNVLSNIDDMNSFFGTCCELLKPGGVMWFDVLNQDSFLSKLRNIVQTDYKKTGRYGPLRPPYVINGFTKNAVKKYSEKYNLEVVLLETSYMGSKYVPYTNPGKILQLIRKGSAAMGYGSMIVSELKNLDG